MSISHCAARLPDQPIPSWSSAPHGHARLRSVRAPRIPLTDSVGVVAQNSFDGDATAAWIRSFGHRAERIDPGQLAARTTLPRVLVVCDRHLLTRVSPSTIAATQVVVLVDGSDPVIPMNGARAVAKDQHAGAAVRSMIAQVLDEPTATRIPMSPREQEVLATYVLGETVKETAAVHFIAECTVRTHYRRVTRRYEDAGRPVGNKAQLLLAMVSDGWLRLDGSLGTVSDG